MKEREKIGVVSGFASHLVETAWDNDRSLDMMLDRIMPRLTQDIGSLKLGKGDERLAGTELVTAKLLESRGYSSVDEHRKLAWKKASAAAADDVSSYEAEDFEFMERPKQWEGPVVTLADAQEREHQRRVEKAKSDTRSVPKHEAERFVESLTFVKHTLGWSRLFKLRNPEHDDAYKWRSALVGAAGMAQLAASAAVTYANVKTGGKFQALGEVANQLADSGSQDVF